MGGPNSAETDGSGGPLSAGDQIFRDRRPGANGPCVASCWVCVALKLKRFCPIRT